MNRIRLRDQVSQEKLKRNDHDELQLASSSLDPSSRRREPQSFFAPLHYEPNYAYPLLVWLHGRGGNERQLRQIMRLISMRNYVAVAPRGPAKSPGTVDAFGWGDSESSFAETTQRVFDCIEAALDRFHIAATRVFLAGFECGGTAALRVALNSPQRFAGALSIGGSFPTCGTPLASLRQARRLPLFIAQGRDSQQYSLDRTCEELRLFHAAGMSVTLRQYPCGDELYSQMLHDTDAWIMEQITGVSSDPPADETGYIGLN